SEDRAAEALGRAAVEHAGFLERAERVCGEDLGPFVTVVARGVAAAEDVAERMRESIERGRLDHGDLAPHLAQNLVHAGPALRVVLVVQPEVEQRELELA